MPPKLYGFMALKLHTFSPESYHVVLTFEFMGEMFLKV